MAPHATAGIEFSTDIVARLSLSTFLSLNSLVTIVKEEEEADGRDRRFFGAAKSTLERSRILANLFRTEVEKIDFGNPPQHFPLLQQSESQIVAMRELILKTVRAAKNALRDDDLIPVVHNALTSCGRGIKDLLTTINSIESITSQNKSVLGNIGAGTNFTNLYRDYRPSRLSTPTPGAVAKKVEESPPRASETTTPPRPTPPSSIPGRVLPAGGAAGLSNAFARRASMKGRRGNNPRRSSVTGLHRMQAGPPRPLPTSPSSPPPATSPRASPPASPITISPRAPTPVSLPPTAASPTPATASPVPDLAINLKGKTNGVMMSPPLSQRSTSSRNLRIAGVPRGLTSMLSPRSQQGALVIEGVDPKKDPLDNAIQLFNTKWKVCLQYLVAEKLVEDTTQSVAKWLFEHNDDLSKVQLGEVLSGQRDNDTDLIKEFTKNLAFKGVSFVQALRIYLSKFMLPGEAQKISRIMEVFAIEFLAQNPGVFPDEDVAFVLSFAIIMLNTDAHNPAIAEKDKMTKPQFVRNNRGTWIDGADPPIELLESLYDEIVHNEIKIKAVGDPDKQGWVKKVEGKERDARSWMVLEGPILKWYKDAKRLESELRGCLVLDYVNVQPDINRTAISITSTLPQVSLFLHHFFHSRPSTSPSL
eukprot:TRINITY_DN511_c1_g1_i3.p1 TRINITY_DN511_c1_g1~~TRINITY_DN511_c1_g1_i3.p1  ORF type:complete len:646 (+),score=161.96 TRINITY_DN511_c1_g1_i3:93-2030(+)